MYVASRIWRYSINMSNTVHTILYVLLHIHALDLYDAHVPHIHNISPPFAFASQLGCVCLQHWGYFNGTARSTPARAARWILGNRSQANLCWCWDVTAIAWLSSTFTYRLSIVSLLCNCRSEMYQFSQKFVSKFVCATLHGRFAITTCVVHVYCVPRQSRDRPIPARIAGSERNQDRD
jgi:hypothetical protein